MAADKKKNRGTFTAIEFITIFITILIILILAILRFDESTKRTNKGKVKHTLESIAKSEKKHFDQYNSFGMLNEISFKYPANDHGFEYSVVNDSTSFLAIAKEKEDSDPLGNGRAGDQMLTLDHNGYKSGW